MSKPRIGYIGLGTMGGAMCGHLLASGYAVTVWGRSRERSAGALDAGAAWADSPAAVADASDIVALCVSNDAAVGDVVFGDTGIATAGGNGKLLIDHSSIHPATTQEWAADLAGRNGMAWLDAPVSGGPGGAARGALIVMAGGAAADFERASPVIDAYAKQITHMGPVGSGQATKVCNQLIIGAEICAIAEALNFARKFGMNASALPDALRGGWADSTVLQDHGRRMAAADYSDPADGSMMMKDMNIACDMGRRTETPMPVTEIVTALYRLAIEQGHMDGGQITPMRLYARDPL
ncbi:MAG: NAD(P)-dependent oxidoreductase [Rickettsiales bacterium]|jgi:3-hydroxyisobutyrate dehydrogenase